MLRGLVRIRRARIWLIPLLALMAIGLLLWLAPVKEWVPAAVEWVHGLGPWSFVGYILLYAMITLVAVPNTPLNIGAGLLFSLLLGFAVAMAGSIIAAFAAFFISRYLLREWVGRKMQKYEKLNVLFDAIEEEGTKVVLLVRVNPFIPASLKNYGFGATDIAFRKYAIGTFFGLMPTCFIYAWLGSLGHLSLTSGEEGLSGTDITIIVAGSVVSLVLVAVLIYYGRRKLEKYEKRRKAKAGG